MRLRFGPHAGKSTEVLLLRAPDYADWVLSHRPDGALGRDFSDLIAAFDEDYFARIRGVWSARSIEIAARLVRGLFPEGDSLALVDAWLAQNEDAPAALRRIVIEQRDHLARDLRVRSAQPA